MQLFARNICMNTINPELREKIKMFMQKVSNLSTEVTKFCTWTAAWNTFCSISYNITDARYTITIKRDILEKQIYKTVLKTKFNVCAICESKVSDKSCFS